MKNVERSNQKKKKQRETILIGFIVRAEKQQERLRSTRKNTWEIKFEFN